METRTVYLIRHGKPEREYDQRRYVGQLDLPLSEDGVEQVRRLPKILNNVNISAVYCSDLARSRRSAEIIAAGRDLPIFPRRELREICLGDWEGCTFADIARRFPDAFVQRGRDIGYFRVPGGESFADCRQRVVAVFYEIMAASAGDIAVVGHAGGNRVLLAQLLGMPLANLFRLAQDYGCFNIIQYRNGGMQVKAVNCR